MAGGRSVSFGNGEESPDSTGQEVPRIGGCRGQYAAGRKAQQKIYRRRMSVRVKWWCKRPPGVEAIRTAGKPLPEQDQIGDDVAARDAINLGFWSHRQMVATRLNGYRIRLTATAPLFENHRREAVSSDAHEK